MADLWGQTENNLSGASDRWDDGLAGEILLADYFAAAPVSLAGLFKVWLGAWALKPVKVWTGSAWAQKPLKRWTGTTWEAV